MNVLYVKRCLLPIIKINIQKQNIKGKKVKYSYVLERQSHLTFSPKLFRTEEHILEGGLTVESGSLADNCIEN